MFFLPFTNEQQIVLSTYASSGEQFLNCYGMFISKTPLLSVVYFLQQSSIPSGLDPKCGRSGLITSPDEYSFSPGSCNVVSIEAPPLYAN